MTRSYRMRLTAVAGLDEQSAFIGKSNPEAAVRFLESAGETFDFLARFPTAGVNAQFAAPRAADIRVWRVKNFPNHLILYRQSRELVEILHVVHARSNWMSLYEDAT